MPYQWVGATLIEPVGRDILQQAENQAQYNVVGGCALTYNGANMTVDLAAGTITHNGLWVAVTAAVGAYTLVSDPSNPRWTWLALNASGAAVLVSGTPATNPTVPALGNNVGVALVKVEAGQTIAVNITYRQDHRVPAPVPTTGAVIASAATLPITSPVHHVSGTTTITAFPTFAAGLVVELTFDGILTVTHNATTLIMLGASNYITVVGDTLTFVSEGSGNWRQIAGPNGGAFTRVASQNAALTTTATTSTTLYTSPTLAILVSQGIRIRGNFRKTATAANAVALGMTMNATTIFSAIVADQRALAYSTATQQAEDGAFEVFIMPRSANYLNGVLRQSKTFVSATGAAAASITTAACNLTNPLPNATITGMTITGINDTANNNVEIFNVTIDTMPV